MICFLCSSIVPKSGLIPFHPQREPYKSYSIRLKHFLTDAGIRRATAFHKTGKIPKLFKWLILGETGYLDPVNSGSDDYGQFEDVDVSDEPASEVLKNNEVVFEPLESSSSSSLKRNKKGSKSSTTITTSGNKRGRKPKNSSTAVTIDVKGTTNNTVSDGTTDSSTKTEALNLTETATAVIEPLVASPKPIKPSDAIKIEALITNANGNSTKIAPLDSVTA